MFVVRLLAMMRGRYIQRRWDKEFKFVWGGAGQEWEEEEEGRAGKIKKKSQRLL
jgi:hypothetical protein